MKNILVPYQAEVLKKGKRKKEMVIMVAKIPVEIPVFKKDDLHQVAHMTTNGPNPKTYSWIEHDNHILQNRKDCHIDLSVIENTGKTPKSITPGQLNYVLRMLWNNLFCNHIEDDVIDFSMEGINSLIMEDDENIKTVLSSNREQSITKYLDKIKTSIFVGNEIFTPMPLPFVCDETIIINRNVKENVETMFRYAPLFITANENIKHHHYDADVEISDLDVIKKYYKDTFEFERIANLQMNNLLENLPFNIGKLNTESVSKLLEFRKLDSDCEPDVVLYRFQLLEDIMKSKTWKTDRYLNLLQQMKDIYTKYHHDLYNDELKTSMKL